MSCFDNRLLFLAMYNKRGAFQQTFKDKGFLFFSAEMGVAGRNWQINGGLGVRMATAKKWRPFLSTAGKK
jgi:hypothetical protein